MYYRGGVSLLLLCALMVGCSSTPKSLTPACSERQVSCQEKVKINPW